MGRKSMLKANGYVEGTSEFREMHIRLKNLEGAILNCAYNWNKEDKAEMVIYYLKQVESLDFDMGEYDNHKLLRFLEVADRVLSDNMIIDVLRHATDEVNPKDWGYENKDRDLTDITESLIKFKNQYR